jgi:hypothetical protein
LFVFVCFVFCWRRASSASENYLFFCWREWAPASLKIQLIFIFFHHHYIKLQ